ncbi:NUMOD4 domain-containing protein [Oceanobacillus oncorhynchi]|uniref:NUMOD4 domain-containing protein n=1 Tax=Oceanobacillus oncorhynchi TaxID=545501 RepID=UPI0034D6D4B0
MKMIFRFDEVNIMYLEIWKDINEFPGYQVSNLGRVRTMMRQSDNKPIVLSQKLSKHGYPRVRLSISNKRKPVTVHKLVATAFLQKPSYAECINHLNGDKTDNRVENLEWTTYQNNNVHAIKKGLRIDNGRNKKVKVVKPNGQVISFKNRTECSQYFGFGYSWVRDRSRKCGKTFEYKDHLIEVVE